MKMIKLIRVFLSSYFCKHKWAQLKTKKGHVKVFKCLKCDSRYFTFESKPVDGVFHSYYSHYHYVNYILK